ncbi:peptidoglycan DD-metalloendopeptidase family protein [Rhodothermus bifroesti]|uniref:Peptidase M23 n=1 Tax=Rhodothermus marinus TaxID=29549 RepID=A0A7V2AYJ9_RHOMR|nr:Murein DD-endopeptidase MepM [bacterium HR18]
MRTPWFLALLLGISLYVTLHLISFSTPPPTVEKSSPPEVLTITYDAFGIEEGEYERLTHRIRQGETFAAILARYEVPYNDILALTQAAKGVFNIRQLQAGRLLHVYRDSTGAQLFVYQPDPVRFVVFDRREPVHVYSGRRAVERVPRVVHGTIRGSLYETLQEAGADPELAVRLSEIFAWQIDFYRIQRGDRFVALYEEARIDGETIGVERILAARFQHQGEDFYAFRFEHAPLGDYYDEQGRNLRKAFLKAPLRYSRITSRYSLSRFHPIQKRYKPHLGTDYAAPAGTPVYATGDGVIIAAGYDQYNGNYVKIRHNAVYTTGYLHFSRIAPGIRPGVRVRQGQVIGYVGSTGLATGPHVCYRFWKNGQQIDPLREPMPPGDPVPDSLRSAFFALRDQLMPHLRFEDSESLYAQVAVREVALTL